MSCWRRVSLIPTSANSLRFAAIADRTEQLEAAQETHPDVIPVVEALAKLGAEKAELERKLEAIAETNDSDTGGALSTIRDLIPDSKDPEVRTRMRSELGRLIDRIVITSIGKWFKGYQACIVIELVNSKAYPRTPAIRLRGLQVETVVLKPIA